MPVVDVLRDRRGDVSVVAAGWLDGEGALHRGGGQAGRAEQEEAVEDGEGEAHHLDELGWRPAALHPAETQQSACSTGSRGHSNGG